jgi:Ca2+-transporting ATPase
MLDKMSDYELKEKVCEVNIFSRVTPEHKMRIVKSLKENGEIVAMTGDGVNDAVALKKADIGIAMGKRGSEVSREAADLILMDDNFSTIIDTIEDGRRIYDNIRSSVGYIFTIHIPIALSSLLAPLLGISLDALMILPIHVVILELLIDPTCSIVLERQPAERNIMNRPPRKKDENILTINILIKSIIQGIIIFLASFITYYIILKNTNEIKLARTCGLVIIMLSNLFLVLVNSSNIDLVFMKIKYFIKDKVMWIVTIGTILFIGLISYSPLNNLFNLAPLSLSLLLLCIMFSFVSVFWYELVKLIKNIKY